MPALIAIDGELEPENRDAYELVYRGSFMQQLTAGWMTGNAVYCRGPNGALRSAAHCAHRYLPHALEAAKASSDGLILAGYSRGGAAAIVLGQLLAGSGITVRCLALFDAIDLDLTVGTGISSNVALTVHGFRNRDSGSRPQWRHCGMISPNRIHRLPLKITHWGASGVTPPVMLPNSRITETVQNGGVRETNVTYQEEIANMKRLWNWMKMHLEGARLVLPPPDQVYSVRQGDSLSLIAGTCLGDVLYWPAIYDANRAIVGANPNYLRIGTVLTIPSIAHLSPAELDQLRERGRNWRAA